MNICFVCSEYPPFKHGGIGSTTQVFGRALAARGHHVRVVGVYPKESFQQPVEQDQGVEVHRIPAHAGKAGGILGRYRIYQTVSRWARKGEIDVVEVPDWEGMAAGWPGMRAPVIVRLHGSLTYFAEEMGAKVPRSTYWIESDSFHRADFCSSTSRYTAGLTEKLFGLHESSPKVLYNFVDVPPVVPDVPRAANRIVYAGSLVTKKGVIPLIQSWPQVLRECPGAELHLYGKDAAMATGPSMREYLIGQLPPDVRPSVTFHGHVTREQVSEAFRTCHAAVFPSFSEAFSLVPLEAMAVGCPVIFSKRHSGPELIQPRQNGLLVEPSNPPEIAAAIVQLLHDPALARGFGKAGSDMVRSRFSRQALLGEYENFYESCAQSFRRSSSQIRALSRLRLSAHA